METAHARSSVVAYPCAGDMDTQLFMECEEEELEPWQMVEQELDEEVDFLDSDEDSLSHASDNGSPPPRMPFVAISEPPPRTTSVSPAMVRLPPPATPVASVSTVMVARTPLAPPTMTPPLILTQGSGNTIFLSPGAGPKSSPFFVPTQGFPGRTAGPVQPLVNPVGQLVFNVQQPLTFVQPPAFGQLVQPMTGPAPIQTSPAGPAHQLDPAPQTSRAPVTMTTAVKATSSSKVVVMVEDFYYGAVGGNADLQRARVSKAMPFLCTLCGYAAKNNINMVEHMQEHSDFSRDHSCCRHCYRQLSSPLLLKTHQQLVHSSPPSSCMCRICEWAFDSGDMYLDHMRTNHKPGEMPYVCQVCLYCTSFYSDLYQHFVSCHANTRILLCVFCLKVTKNCNVYQHHVLRHKVSQVFHCNMCRLQFVSMKAKMEHRQQHHRTARKPAVLQQAPPGTKVTIRYEQPLPQRPAHAQPIVIKEAQKHSVGWRPSPAPKLPSPAPKLPSPAPKLPSPAPKLLSPAPSPRTVPHGKASSGCQDRQLCMECGCDASDFTGHYPSHMMCPLCSYSTSCSRAYASHMTQVHVPGTRRQPRPQHQQCPPCCFLLSCSQCSFVSRTGDRMAEHLQQNPGHSSSLCQPRTYEEPDVYFCPNVAGPEEDLRADTRVEPPWASADGWTPAGTSDHTGGDEAEAPLPPGGPNHALPRTADVLDYFALLFPPALVELVAAETNAHAKLRRCLGAGAPDWVPVDGQEVRAFLGLVVLMGLSHLPDPAHYWSFHHHDNSYAFTQTMSYVRFRQIADHIRMGAVAAAADCDRGSLGDGSRAFGPMLELLGAAAWAAYRPNACLAIDRALLPCLEGEGQGEGQPHVWLLCDSKSGYCHRFLVRAGQPGASVVLPLVAGLEGGRHQLYLASSLASVPLLRALLERGLRASSYVTPRTPALPAALWDRGRCLQRPGDFLQWRHGPLLVTRWMDAREMGCLCSNAPAGQPDTVWRRSQTQPGELAPVRRPRAFRLLQENMRGADICKQLLACNPLGGAPADRRWRQLFWLLVNVSVVNAFILLRESRRDRPPPWVHDGLFSQAGFRRRLGDQLARCGRQHPGEGQLAARTPGRRRGGEGEEEEEEQEREGVPVGRRQWHRMRKISVATKRCKNCHLKKIRHESVYGCAGCNASLCNTAHCFWEFHGFPASYKGSVKIGFVKDRISGAVALEEPEGSADAFMAPVEELEDDEEEAARQQPEPRPLCADQPEAAPVRQLRVALLALCVGVCQAALAFATETRLIRAWLRAGRRRLGLPPAQTTPPDQPPAQTTPPDQPPAQTTPPAQPPTTPPAQATPPAQSLSAQTPTTPLVTPPAQATPPSQTMPQAPPLTKAPATLPDPDTPPAQALPCEGELALAEWVLARREQQLPLEESVLFQKVSELKQCGAFGPSFRISYDWALGFMLRHRLGPRRWRSRGSVARSPPVARPLPGPTEERAALFARFTHRQLRLRGLPPGTVGALSELRVFVDAARLRCRGGPDQGHGALALSGVDPPLLTLYLSALANGTALPSLALLGAPWTSAPPPPPNLLLVEARAGGFSPEEGLQLWLSRVWRPREGAGGKSLLVLDGHRGHTGDAFLDGLGAAGTLPAVVPAGCSARLQPLDVSVRPVLQTQLLGRWAELCGRGLELLLGEEAGGGAAPEQLLASVAGWLVGWLLEVLPLVADRPQHLQECFRLTGLLPGETGEEKESPANAQTRLLGELAEALMGADDDLPPASPDDLETDEEEEEEEERAAGQMQSEEDKETVEISVDKEGGKKEISEEGEEIPEEAGEKEISEDKEEGDEVILKVPERGDQPQCEQMGGGREEEERMEG